jgi:hypothetical protein
MNSKDITIITGHLQRVAPFALTRHIPDSPRGWVWVEGLTIEQLQGCFKRVEVSCISDTILAFPCDTAAIESMRFEYLPRVAVSSTGYHKDVLGREYYDINNEITIQ